MSKATQQGSNKHPLDREQKNKGRTPQAEAAKRKINMGLDQWVDASGSAGERECQKKQRKGGGEEPGAPKLSVGGREKGQEYGDGGGIANQESRIEGKCKRRGKGGETSKEKKKSAQSWGFSKGGEEGFLFIFKN